MNFLEMISMFLPGLGFLAMGFADDKGGGPDPKGDSGDDPKGADGIDPTIKALQADPDGIAKLLEQKRSANAEAKASRLKLEKLEAAAAEEERKKLADQGEFQKLSEQLKNESAKRAEVFKSRMIIKELQVEAIGLQIRNPEDVKLASMEGVDFNDETLSVTGAKEAIEKLKETRPYLFHDGEEESDESGKTKAHEAAKGSVKTNLKKFDFANTNTRERFAIPFKKS